MEEKDNDDLDILMRWTRLIFCSGVAHDNDADVILIENDLERWMISSAWRASEATLPFYLFF